MGTKTIAALAIMDSLKGRMENANVKPLDRNSTRMENVQSAQCLDVNHALVLMKILALNVMKASFIKRMLAYVLKVLFHLMKIKSAQNVL